jgi:putative SOS response-associated peptidase YedK
LSDGQPVTDAAGRTTKRPHYIRIGDQPVFGMAGLWDASTRDDGSVVESCAVITVPANAVMNVIDGAAESDDGRMPAILTREEREVWLHGTPEEAFACLWPYSDELTIPYPVSVRVISTKNNDERPVEEIV